MTEKVREKLAGMDDAYIESEVSKINQDITGKINQLDKTKEGRLVINPAHISKVTVEKSSVKGKKVSSSKKSSAKKPVQNDQTSDESSDDEMS